MAQSAGQLFGGSWTEDKLKILKSYLERYNTVLKKQAFIRVYVDAFAGTGYREQRKRQYEDKYIFEDLEEDESKEFLKGSAKLALEANPSFHRYVFIESDQNKINELRKLRTDFPEKETGIEIAQGDANDFVLKFCDATDWKKTRAVLFLDPFATEVKWTTIEAVAKTQCIDVWILFPLMAVNRLLAKDAQKIWYDRLNDIFGTPDWFENFYKTRSSDDIFGESDDTIEKTCDFASIGKFYKSRLEAIFSGVARNPKTFYNSRGSALFQFFFASGNPRGAKIAIKIAEHLMKEL